MDLNGTMGLPEGKSSFAFRLLYGPESQPHRRYVSFRHLEEMFDVEEKLQAL